MIKTTATIWVKLEQTWNELSKNKVWEFKMVRFFVYELNLHVIYDLFKNISCFEQ